MISHRSSKRNWVQGGTYTNAIRPDFATEDLIERSAQIGDSYNRLLGRSLLVGAFSRAAFAVRLYHAPAVVLMHDRRDPPSFCYANAAALELYQMSEAQIKAMPSHMLADPAEREKRAEMLRQVEKYGYVEGYDGIRVLGNGARIEIENATVFNVTSNDGATVGQATMFSSWKPA